MEKTQGNEKVKGQEGRNGTRDEARQIGHGKEKRMSELGKGIALHDYRESGRTDFEAGQSA